MRKFRYKVTLKPLRLALLGTSPFRGESEARSFKFTANNS